MAAFSELTGSTPLVELTRFNAAEGAGAHIFAKLESFNPAGSAKDRAALAMIEDAEERGLLREGGTIIEPTSGNTGIGLAAAALTRGYKVILTMPDTMSAERITLLRAYGAEIVLTPGALGMDGSIREAHRIAEATPGAFIPDQFSNPANPLAHYRTTGPEIVAALGAPDAFVACIGTGGTITGVARYLAEAAPGAYIAGVEPAESPLITEGRSGAHGIQGIGANFIPAVLDLSVIDEVMTVSTADAYRYARALAHDEGILAGISSGAALAAALRLSRRPEFAGGKIVALLPDGGDRYMSCGVFS